MRRPSPKPFGRLVELVLARPRTVVVAWAVLTVVAAVAATGLAGRLNDQGLFIEESESGMAAKALDTHVPALRGVPTIVVVTTTIVHPARRWAAPTALARHEGVEDHISRAILTLPYSGTLAEIGQTTQVDERRTRHTVVSVLSLRLRVGSDAAQRTVARVRSTLEDAVPRSASVGVLGGHVVAERYATVARRDVTRAERIALPFTFAVLLVAFVSLAAAAFPLLLASVTLVVTLGILAVVASMVGVSTMVTTTVSVLALGLSIDYSLFLVTRYREEAAPGVPLDTALSRAMESTGRAILLSGLSIATALMSLLVVGVDVFSSMALGGTIASLVAVATALTLLPAMIHLLGPRIERLSVGRARRSADRGTLWRGLAGAVVSRPLLATVLSLCVLVPLAMPAISLRPEVRTLGDLPSGDPVVREAEHVAKAFGVGAVAPVEIVTNSARPAFTRRLEDDPNVREIRVNEGEDGWYLTRAMLGTSPDAGATERTIRRLRSRLGTSDRPAYVGGLTAAEIDLTDRVHARTPLVVLAAAVMGFLALAIGLRSLVIPIKAILGTLLSVGATLGLLTLLFPSTGGTGLELLVPLVVFTIVFGLSIDYEVFLLSRVREEALRGASTRDAVRTALIRSGRSITLAGICLATVFAALVTSSLDTFQQLGAGVAIAVVIDVTLVRCVLMPAATVLFGRWNWWLPGKGPLRPEPRPGAPAERAHGLH